MKTERVALDVIDVSSRLRPLNEAAVLRMMEGFRQAGQLAPIAVHSTADGQVILVAGAHRIEAARRLGWNEIEAVFVDGTDVERELHEITENLHRAELTALERSTQIARWAELMAAKVSQVATPTNGGDQPKEKGVRKVARDLGLDKDDVSRAVKVAKLSDQAKAAARDAGIDNNRTALLEVAKEATPEKQIEKVAQIAEAKAVKAAAKKPSKDKLEIAKRTIQRQLDANHAARMRGVEEEIRLRVIAENKDYLAMVKEKEAKARKDETLWREIIDGHKPPFTVDQFKTILMCLHPDGERTADKLADAFRLFNGKKLQLTGGKS